MTRVGVISASMLCVFLVSTAPGYTQQEQQGEKPKQQQGDKKAKPKQQAKPRKQQPAAQQQEEQRKQQQRGQQQQQQQQQQRGQQQQRAQQQGQRLSQDRQRQLVAQQQQRLTQYRQHLDQQQRVLQQQSAQLQQQRRTAQYRFQGEYLARLRQQQTFLQNNGHPDYDRDPYFYSAPIYRYNRGGRYYETNQYGADLLRQAVNYGYQEGFRAGDADRQDHWRSSYQDSFAYQDANYGYTGYYVDRDDYNYYFREGFRRGYEDGYSSQYRYGRYVNGSYSLLGAILSQILGFQPLR